MELSVSGYIIRDLFCRRCYRSLCQARECLHGHCNLGVVFSVLFCSRGWEVVGRDDK